MARTAITVVETSRAGVEVAFSPASTDGNSFTNDGFDTMLLVKNGGAAAITATVPVVTLIDGNAVSPLTIDIPAGSMRVMGPFPRVLYNQSDGSVAIDFSDTASIELAAVKLGPAAY